MIDLLFELFRSPMAYFHVLLVLSMAAMVYRFVAGPTEYDRLAAFECFVIAFLTFVALQVVELRKDWVLDFILVLSVVGYLSTVALAEFQGLGELPDPDRASVVFSQRSRKSAQNKRSASANEEADIPEGAQAEENAADEPPREGGGD